MASSRTLLCLTAASLSVTAFGQAAPEARHDESVTKLERFVVTGSYIPAAADEANALPVQIVDAKEIEQTGVTKSLLDVLRKAVPQIVGGLNIGTENANIAGNSTNGGSQVALRNTTTLVLIDGQRVAFSPVAGTGGYQFVDLNIIPVSAVERVEVLTDGASAIYGSDAVSGVVNIILKKNYQGAEIGGYYGFTRSDKTNAYYRDRSARLVAGASSGGTQLTVSAEWTKSDPLYEKDYNYTSPVYLSPSYPGVINSSSAQFYRLNPALNAPPAAPASIASLVSAGVYSPVPTADIPLGFDTSKIPTFSGALDKQIASMALEHAISSVLTMRASLLYSKTSNEYQLNPQPIVLVVNRPTDPTTQNLPGIPFTDANVTVRNRFIAYDPRVYINDTSSLRGTIQLDGKIGENWTWSAGAVYNESRQDAVGKNQILNSALVAGIRAGLINLTAITQDPAKFSQANIFGDSSTSLTSRLISYDARVAGRLFNLPAGPVETAAGVGYRKETLKATADMNSIINPATGTSAWNNGVTLNPFDAERTIEAMFLELKVPIASPQKNLPGLYALSLDGAIRRETYSDTDDPTVPKISLRWLPIDDQFAFRATYSKSFSAPTLYSLFGPTNSGSTPSLTGLTAYNSAGQPIGPFPAIQGNQQSGSNPNLRPSRSKNYTLGFIYSPRAVKGLSLSVDYYHIKETDIVGTLAATTTMVQDVERYGPASHFVNYIHLNNFGQLGGTTVTAPGQLSPNPANMYVDQFASNVTSQQQDGFDVTFKYSLPTRHGTFDFSSSWVYLNSFRIEAAPGDGYTEYTGTNGYGTLPRFREYSTVAWQSGAWAASVSNTYIDSVTSAGSGEQVPSFTTFDLQASVDLGKLWPKAHGLKITMGINNLFDKYPPVDDTVFSDPPTDSGLYGAFGRFYYVDFTYKF